MMPNRCRPPGASRFTGQIVREYAMGPVSPVFSDRPLPSVRPPTGAIRMIRRIELIDFMAHQRTVLELDPGVTVLTGPNNTGKSAVVEAVRSIAENPPGRALIRHGARQALVRVELASGELVEWERTSTRALYRIRPAGTDPAVAGDDEAYAKFGRTPPEDVRALLRLDPIQTETGKVDIHIGNQRYPIFLLDQSGAQAASFFAASTEAEYLLQMQQELKARTDAAKRRRKELLQHREQLQQALKNYTSLPALEQAIAAAESLHQHLERDRKALPALAEALQELTGTVVRTRFARRSQRLLEPLTAPPALFDCGVLQQVLRDLGELGRRRREAGGCLNVLIPLSAPQSLQTTRELEALRRDLAATGLALATGSRRQVSLWPLHNAPELLATASLERALNSLRDTRCQHQQTHAVHQVVQTTAAPPPLFEVGALREMAQDLRRRLARTTLMAAEKSTLNALKSPPEAAEAASLAQLIQQIRKQFRASVQIRAKSSALATLKAPMEALATQALSQALADLRQRTAVREAAAAQQQRIEADLAERRAALKDLIERTGICPLCRQPLDLDHLLESAHDH